MATPKEITLPTGQTLSINCCSFASIRQEMEGIESLYPQYSRFEIQMESIPYDHSDRDYPFIYGVRMETMEEAEAREATEAAARQAREDRERAEFERLSAKFKNA